MENSYDCNSKPIASYCSYHDRGLYNQLCGDRSIGTQLLHVSLDL